MSESLLRELATKIAQEQFLLQWPIYALMVAIAIVVGMSAAFFSAYAKRRGENYATKTDFDALLKQLQATTAVAEEVKAAVSHADWASREMKTLRRVKLETLLQSVYELQEWQEVERDVRIFNSNKDAGTSPLPKIEILSCLYFPELQAQINDVCQNHRNMMIELLDFHAQLLNATGNDSKQLQIRKQFKDAWNEIYKSQLNSISVIERASRELMLEVIGA